MRKLVIVTVVAAVVVACSSGAGPGPAPPAPAAQQPAPTAPPPAVAASNVASDPTFLLRLSEAGPYATGQIGRFVVELQPRGVYHVNQEYPMEISLTTDAETGLAKTKLERPDAAEFTETRARFDVPFTPKAAGERKVQANVKFAVCTKENCVPDERNLVLSLAVK